MKIPEYSYEEMDKTFAYAKAYYGDDEEIASLLEDIGEVNRTFKTFFDELQTKDEVVEARIAKKKQLSMICIKIGQRIGELAEENHNIWHALSK